MQGKIKAGRQQMRWIEKVKSSTQMNMLEFSKATKKQKHTKNPDLTRSRKRLDGT
jgi:hypothetical protein